MSHLPPNAKGATESDAADAAIIQAAAAWRTRLDAGLAPGEEAQLSAWLEADDRHAEIFGQMDTTWSLLDRAPEIPLERLGGTEAGKVLPFPGGPVARLRMVRWVGTLAAAAAIVIMGIVAWRGTSGGRPQYAVAASAGAGLVKRVNLPDGSTVRLNSGATVHVTYSRASRRIELTEGEASFEVAKDAARPFVVRTAGVDVRAIGTVFTVSRRSQAVEVLVTEGKVQVNEATRGGSLLAPPLAAPTAEKPEATKSTLAAGEKVVIAVQSQTVPAPASPIAVPPAEIAEALAWQERRLDFFDSTPLSEIAAQFNRFNHHQLVVADAGLAGQRFAGSFRADDPETFLQLIETRPGVRVERRSHETVIRRVP